MGQLVAREIEKAGGIAKEFNTIAIDDGIAMGHDGMLYSLPSRDLIADSVNIWSTRTAPTRWCVSPTATRSPGHADGRDAPQYSVIFRFRRADGGGQGQLAGQGEGA